MTRNDVAKIATMNTCQSSVMILDASRPLAMQSKGHLQLIENKPRRAGQD